MKAWNYTVGVAPASFHLFQNHLGRCGLCRQIVCQVKAYINDKNECFVAEKNLSVVKYGDKIDYLGKEPR